MKPSYVPKVSGDGDVGNFSVYDDDSDMSTPSIKPNEDPFIDW